MLLIAEFLCCEDDGQCGGAAGVCDIVIANVSGWQDGKTTGIAQRDGFAEVRRRVSPRPEDCRTCNFLHVLDPYKYSPKRSKVQEKFDEIAASSKLRIQEKQL